jgi:hypothetical protein
MDRLCFVLQICQLARAKTFHLHERIGHTNDRTINALDPNLKVLMRTLAERRGLSQR